MALMLSEDQVTAWFVRHRRVFYWPVRVLTVPLLVVACILIIPSWLIERVMDGLNWIDHWLHVIDFWAKLPDDAPELTSFRAFLDRKEALRK